MDERFKELNVLYDTLKKQVDDVDRKRKEILTELHPDLLGGANFTIGGWACEASPCGLCVYDDCYDYEHEECLFCDEPEEREVSPPFLDKAN